MSRVVDTFTAFGRTCEAIQQRIIELDNEPRGRKTLRAFGLREVLRALGCGEAELRLLPEAAPVLRRGGRLDLETIGRLRQAMAAAAPQRAPGRRLGEPLRTLAVANFKGGVGKTTTAVHLAQHLTLRGYRVLLVDLDSQASATSLFGFQPDIDFTAEQTLWSYLRGDRQDLVGLVVPTHWPGLDLLPANLALYRAEFELPVLQREERDFRFWRLLEHGLADLGERYDVVVCDCPPSLGYLSINALFAADGLIVPAPASMLDFASTGRFFQMVADTLSIIERYEAGSVDRLGFVRILITRFSTADRNQQALVDWMRHTYRGEVMESRMVMSTALDLAGNVKRTLYELEPGTSAALDRAIEHCDAVNLELEALLQRSWGRPLPQRPGLAA